MQSSFKHPKVFADLSQLYKQYWLLHNHLPKSFRYTTGEIILNELTAVLRYIVLVNMSDKTEQHNTNNSTNQLQSARSSMAVIRAMFNLGWQLKIISHNAFAEFSHRIDEIEKQLTGWQQWFDKLPYPIK